MLPAALLLTRTGGWESIGSVFEESSPVPENEATRSENQVGSGSLVGGKIEDFPGSQTSV